MSFSARWREAHAELYRAAREHPYVAGIGDGSLPEGHFVRWLRQDWLYLLGYTEAIEAAAALADTEEARAFWGELAVFTRREELDHHEALAATFGVSREALDATEPYRATRDYLGVLAGRRGDYAGLVATLTPCAVGYAEIAVHLGGRGASPVPAYQNWIDTYLDEGFQATVPVFTRELDRVAAAAEGALREEIEAAYVRALRCELDFWEGLWQGGPV